ncbi:MAG: hypothetical protein HRK26_04575 [Rickettsiaceae bacterium H1]|nr:hypothetical protein [Rickettsiaceae bacterium H1]
MPNKWANLSREKIKTIFKNVWFQETSCSVLEVSLKAALVIISTLYKDKINPYMFAWILIFGQYVVLCLILRGTYFTWTRNNKQEELLEKLENQNISENRSEQPRKFALNRDQKLKFSILGIIGFQLLYIILSVITPLLHQYERIALRTVVIMGAIAFVFGVIPNEIFSTISVATSRIGSEKIEEITSHIKDVRPIKREMGDEILGSDGIYSSRFEEKTASI